MIRDAPSLPTLSDPFYPRLFVIHTTGVKALLVCLFFGFVVELYTVWGEQVRNAPVTSSPCPYSLGHLKGTTGMRNTLNPQFRKCHARVV